ncbi:MAG: hypothetical protein QXN75_03645 [Thermoproteota archaeon]
MILGDEANEVLVILYYRKLKTEEGKEDLSERKISAKIDKKEGEILSDLMNRRNIEKHIKKSYGHAFTKLLWAGNTAEEISKEFDVEVKVFDSDYHWGTYFTSVFDSKDMDEEHKLKKIKKRVEAVVPRMSSSVRILRRGIGSFIKSCWKNLTSKPVRKIIILFPFC